MKPSACASITLDAIFVCTGGKCNGANSNELILGPAGYDDIAGKNGDDCIVGGGDDAIIRG